MIPRNKDILKGNIGTFITVLGIILLVGFAFAYLCLWLGTFDDSAEGLTSGISYLWKAPSAWIKGQELIPAAASVGHKVSFGIGAFLSTGILACIIAKIVLSVKKGKKE